MSTRWNNIVKDYFTFSAKERKAVVIVLFLIVAVYLSARLFPAQKTVPSKEAFAKELAQLKIAIDTTPKSYVSYSYKRNDEEDNADNSYTTRSFGKNEISGELFAFDPNTLDADGWQRLGIKDKTISTIQKFLSKGFRFKQPEDMKRVYGLRPADAERLMPYVHIAPKTPVAVNAPATNQPSYQPSYTNAPNKYAATRTVSAIEINGADTTAFISLPGIGSRLAFRIVSFREKLGGFYKIEQVGETYGVPDSTFQKIKSYLLCNTAAVKKISVNTADINQLKSHPYIRWSVGNAIISYRSQHGNFTSIQDLRKIDLITEDVFDKMAPYVQL